MNIHAVIIEMSDFRSINCTNGVHIHYKPGDGIPVAYILGSRMPWWSIEYDLSRPAIIVSMPGSKCCDDFEKCRRELKTHIRFNTTHRIKYVKIGEGKISPTYENVDFPLYTLAQISSVICEALSEFLAENDIRGCHIVGFHTGGNVAIEVAARDSFGIIPVYLSITVVDTTFYSTAEGYLGETMNLFNSFNSKSKKLLSSGILTKGGKLSARESRIFADFHSYINPTQEIYDWVRESDEESRSITDYMIKNPGADTKNIKSIGMMRENIQIDVILTNKLRYINPVHVLSKVSEFKEIISGIRIDIVKKNENLQSSIKKFLDYCE